MPVMSKPIESLVTAETLQSIKLCKPLAHHVRERIALLARGRRYPPNHRLFTHDDPSCNVNLIVSGRVRVSYCTDNGRVITFRDHQAGDMFGELSALDDLPRSAEVRTLDEVFLVDLPQRAFLDLITEHAALSHAVMRHLVGLVRALSTRVVEYSSLPVAQRVHAELARLSRVDPARPKRYVIDPAPTQAELASRVSTHREAVARELSKLVKAGVIERHGKILFIRDMQALAL
jgi:CRP-like cAMP-binding protein